MDAQNQKNLPPKNFNFRKVVKILKKYQIREFFLFVLKYTKS